MAATAAPVWPQRTQRTQQQQHVDGAGWDRSVSAGAVLAGATQAPQALRPEFWGGFEREWFSHQAVTDVYVPVKKLGAGSFASVVLADERETGSRVAVKVLKMSMLKGNDENQTALSREVELLHQISSLHPNIVELYAVHALPAAGRICLVRTVAIDIRDCHNRTNPAHHHLSCLVCAASGWCCRGLAEVCQPAYD